jgi:hypothetical protein
MIVKRTYGISLDKEFLKTILQTPKTTYQSILSSYHTFGAPTELELNI